MLESEKKIPLNEAKKILRSYEVQNPPVRLSKIADALGIDVIETKLEDKISGFIKLRGKQNRPVIVINNTHPKTRRRFTFAHELGHYVLHSFYPFHIDTETVEFRNKKSSLAISRKEIQANQFAAELLMPQHLLVKDIGSKVPNIESPNGHILITKLAKKYQVSQQAMTIRLGVLFQQG